jgi:hypothetical protein
MNEDSKLLKPLPAPAAKKVASAPSRPPVANSRAAVTNKPDARAEHGSGKSLHR